MLARFPSRLDRAASMVLGCARPLLGASLFAALVTTACGGGGEATVTERLWVSGVPTKPTTRTTAFLATKTKDGEFIGAFFQGSAYRGGHDVFSWTERGKDAASLKFLQDGQTFQLRFKPCTPSPGFDHCVLVEGDPTGAGKYQSRKRWRVRKSKKKDATVADVLGTFAALTEQDEDLNATFASPR